mmetsp:Transcript_15453/g.50440  ORF Transcript_15453/g.50440 Transcript_15453/m.50440 type:complete len:207 (+) Transcript_15453:406-1026(+)
MWRPRQIHRMSPRRRCGRKSKSTRPSPCSAFRIVSSHLPPFQNGRRCVDPGKHRGRRLVKVAHFDPPLGIGWRSQRFFLLGASWSRWAAEEYHSASAAERAKQVLRNGISDMNYLRWVARRGGGRHQVRREAFLGRPRLRCADGEVEERRHGVVTLHVRIAVGHGTHAQASGAQRADARQDIGEEVGARLRARGDELLDDGIGLGG